MPRQQSLHQFDRPHLQGLREQGVARVGEAALSDFPGLVEGEVALIHQQSHEFGHSDYRVGVVQLENHPLAEIVQVESLGEGVVHEIADRTSDEEILLLESKFLALRGGVLGV